MPSTERRPRRIDLKLPPSGGGATADAATTEPVPPAIPAPPAPSGLTVEDTFLIQSAVTPQAGANLAWYAPSGLVPDRYALQWATNSGFTTPTTRDVPGGGQTTAGVDGLPVGTAVYFRVAAVVRGVQGAWSNTASATMPADTTAPAAPTHASTAYTWSGLTGDLTINWVNPTSANFRDVRVRIYASNGGTLYREVYSATGAYTWTLGQHFTDTSNTPDPAVYVVLTSRSWGGVFSATDLTFSPAIGAPTTPAGFASSWAADDGTASADLLFTWTRSNAVADYQLTLNGTARRVGHNDRYLLTFAQNQAENGGTADPSILNAALVAVDALGQVSGTPAFLTPTNAAPPATTVTAFAGSSAVGLTITPSAARDLKDYRVRVYLATVLVDTVYVPNARPTITIQHGDGSYTFDVSARDLFDQVGTASAQTAAVDLVDWDAFLDELRSGAVYSDQLATAAETLHDAYTDDNRASGGVAYATNASWVRWIRFERLERERYRTVTLAMAPAGGTTNWYIRTSEDATTWAYYAGPVTSSRILTAVANAAAAQAAPVSAATLGNSSASRVDFPAILSARYVEVWLRNTTSSTTVNEFYPRRLVQSDDLEAEAIKAIHITTDAILSNHITATAIDGFTITGATIQTAASGERVVLDSTGLKTYDSAGVLQVEATTATDGKLTAGAGDVKLDATGILVREAGTSLSSPKNAYNIGPSTGSPSAQLFTTVSPDTLTSSTYLYGRPVNAGGTDYDTDVLIVSESDDTPRVVLRVVGLDTTEFILTDGMAWSSGGSLRASVGLNLGSETGAGTGQIRASGTATIAGGLNVGSATGAATGQVRMSGDLRIINSGNDSAIATDLTASASYTTLGSTNAAVSALKAMRINAGAIAVNGAPVGGVAMKINSPGDTSASYPLVVASNGGNNLMYINSQTSTTCEAWVADTAWTYGSDEEMKEAIRPLGPDALGLLRRLAPKRFRYRGDPRERVGFIAQEVRAVIAELVSEAEGGSLGLRTTDLIPYIVAAIIELADRGQVPPGRP
jgi:hypothetical protein